MVNRPLAERINLLQQMLRVDEDNNAGSTSKYQAPMTNIIGACLFYWF
jgi:hypothetical protein